MIIRLLFVSGTSACFELDNDRPYYAPEKAAVYLNDEKQFDTETNVFSLFDLKPDTRYRLDVQTESEAESIVFQTKQESFAADVRQFGAVGDGVHDDTHAVQSALHFLPDHSRLYFPRGVYLCRPLALRSHITLEFDEGAVLLGSADRQQYPVIPGTVRNLNGGRALITGAFEGLARDMYQSLIHAENCEDIVITGRGVVDGNAQNSDFWTEFRNFETARPRLMFFCRCKDVTVHGVTGKNSPSWNLHPFYSENISFYDMAVEAPKDSPNTDAIDPEGCNGVNIIGCRLSVGDDCIAIKSGKMELCRMEKSPADRHVIRNCLMAFGHGAVTLGSETASGVTNLTVNRCVFRQTDRGLRIKTRRGRGKDCFISDILFENILMDHVITPVVINMWYNCCDPDRFSDYVKCRTPLPVDDRTPHLGTFTFRDLTCTGAHAAACYIDGLPEAPIDKVSFENVKITFAENARPFVPAMQNDAVPRLKMGLYFNNVRHVCVKDTCVTGVVGGPIIAHHCETVETENLSEVE